MILSYFAIKKTFAERIHLLRVAQKYTAPWPKMTFVDTTHEMRLSKNTGSAAK